MNEDILYGAGSDDFRGYVWKIPELSTLLRLRREINADEWMSHEWTGACGEFLGSSNVILFSFAVRSSLLRRPMGNKVHPARN